MRKIISLLILFTIAFSFFSGYAISFFKYQKYQPLEEAMQNIAKHEYTDDYQCLQFSQDLQKELKNKGIHSSIIIVKQLDNLHAVVGVWFEPQTGEYADETDSVRIYK